MERAAVHRLEREALELLARHSAAQQLPDKCWSARSCGRTDEGRCHLSGVEGFCSAAAACEWRDHALRQAQSAPMHMAAHHRAVNNAPWSYASRWAAFAEAPPASITYSDVPWPPDATSDLLTSITAYSIEMQHGDEAKAVADTAAHPASCAEHLDATSIADSIRRRAHRLATLRWHPDKFEQRFGSAMAAADRGRILQRTQDVCQGLNDMRSDPSI